MRCPAGIQQKGEEFILGSKRHSSRCECVQHVGKTKIKAASLIEAVMVRERKPDDLNVLSRDLLKRVANRACVGTRPTHPDALHFEVICYDCEI